MRRILQASLLALLGGLLLAAHDTWLVTETFFVAPSARVQVALNTSEDFPKPEAAPTPDRITSFFIQGRSRVPVTGYRVEGDSLVADIEVGDAGHYVVAATTRPRMLVLPAKDFNQYVSEEGLTQILALRQQRGQAETPGRESYSKIAKLALCAGEPESGESSDENFRQPLGLRLEIVPLASPCRLRVGDTLPVQVVFDGQPLVGVQVGAGYAGVHGHHYPVWLKTDAEGRAAIPLDRSGPWFVRTLHMIPASRAEADWESWFSTLTFAVR